jgi:SET domain-containing protein
MNTTVAVKRSATGLGLFATQAFVKDDVIVEYCGETISTEEADERGGKYLAILNKEWVIDGRDRSNLARYINHSCKPNAYFELNEAETQIFAVAKKRIALGEEVTVHYGKDYFNQHIKPIGCKCAVCTSQS